MFERYLTGAGWYRRSAGTGTRVRRLPVTLGRPRVGRTAGRAAFIHAALSTQPNEAGDGCERPRNHPSVTGQKLVRYQLPLAEVRTTPR